MNRTIRYQSYTLLFVLALFVFFGFHGDASGTEQCSKGTWTTMAFLPSLQSLTAAAEIEGKLYVVGGYDTLSAVSTLEIYDPATDSWTAGAPTPTPRAALAAAAIHGRLYVVGGANANHTFGLSSLEVYDPATNTWATMAPMPTPRA